MTPIHKLDKLTKHAAIRWLSYETGYFRISWYPLV